jgi:hypothetical protein
MTTIFLRSLQKITRTGWLRDAEKLRWNTLSDIKLENMNITGKAKDIIAVLILGCCLAIEISGYAKSALVDPYIQDGRAMIAEKMKQSTASAYTPSNGNTEIRKIQEYITQAKLLETDGYKNKRFNKE